MEMPHTFRSRPADVLPLSYFLIEKGRCFIPHGRRSGYIVNVVADQSGRR